MRNLKVYQVLPCDGGWKVTLTKPMAYGDPEGPTEEVTEVVGSFLRISGQNKAHALKWAIGQAKAKQPSSVRIHKSNGQFQSERTFPRSRDPKSKG